MQDAYILGMNVLGERVPCGAWHPKYSGFAKNPTQYAAERYVQYALGVVRDLRGAGQITREESIRARAEIFDFRSGVLYHVKPGEPVSMTVSLDSPATYSVEIWVMPV